MTTTTTTATATGILATDLRKALQRVKKFQPKKSLTNLKPVMEYARLEINGRVTIDVNNLDSGIVCSLTPKSKSGESSALFRIDRLLKALPKHGHVELTIKENQLSCNGETFTNWNPDEKPVTTISEDYDATATVNASDLWNAINYTSQATDEDSFRYALGGIKIEVSGNRVYFIGTDGQRLHCVEVEVRKNGKDGEGILPAESARKIRDAIGRNAIGTVDIGITRNAIYFGGIPGQVYSRQVEGRFPNWRDVIPEKNNRIIDDMKTSQIDKSLAFINKRTSGESRGLKIKTTDDGVVAITKDLVDSDTGVTCSLKGELMAGSSVEGSKGKTSEFQTTLNGHYLADALLNLGSFSLYAENKKSAHLIIDNTGRYQAVVMPLS